MALPLLKLETLVLKTISKPIANRLKKQAGLHPRFRQLIINFAQANHRFQTNMQRRFYGHATDAEIRPLNEEKAIQAAGDLLGELFIFSWVTGVGMVRVGHRQVAGAIVIFEVQRSARSEARKEELRRQELEPMTQKDEELAREVELLKHKLEELEHLASGRGLNGIFNFKHPQATESVKSATPH